MEYQDTDYGREETVSEELRHAAEVRHWPPEKLAEATSLPEERVTGHLEGQETPSPQELTRYSAALGLSSERLLARAVKEGLEEARKDEGAALLAAKALLEEAWGKATPQEREQLLEQLERLAGGSRPAH